jgi:hypothetical protein
MKIQKMLGLAALFAAVAVTGCGGSGGSDPFPPPPPPEPPAVASGKVIASFKDGDVKKSIQGADLGSYSYTPTPGGSFPVTTTVTNGLYSLQTTRPTGLSFTGAALMIGLAKADQDLSFKKKLFIELQAVAPNKKLLVKLHSTGVVSDNGCLPANYITKTVISSDTVTVVGLDLNAATFPLEPYCLAPDSNNPNPAFAEAIKSIDRIEIIDNGNNTGTSTGAVPVDFKVGKITVQE